MNVKYLQALADSSAWKEVSVTLIASRIMDLKDVTKPIDANIEMKPEVVMLAKIAAAKALEDLVNEINRYSDNNIAKQVKNFD